MTQNLYKETLKMTKNKSFLQLYLELLDFKGQSLKRI